MAVLCLMYHQTPKGKPNERWDVPLHIFQDQIKEMIDAGIKFIEFSEVQKPEYLASGMRVAITFDDGHASNAPAFEFLASKGIRPMSFIVMQWSRECKGFLSSKEIEELSSVCAFGAHGATHTALTSLSLADLRSELTDSRSYLEDILSVPIRWMALPGGKGNALVLSAVAAAGYQMVGNSVPDLNRRVSLLVNRPCVTTNEGAEAPLRWATAGQRYWLSKRLRRAVSGLGVALIGEQRYVMARDKKRLRSK
jgi:peptidoglycan/xylan/chitin deacetylase (PgdA/CDA1 family)